jgi:hypothetical protein
MIDERDLGLVLKLKLMVLVKFSREPGLGSKVAALACCFLSFIPNVNEEVETEDRKAHARGFG